MKGFIVICSTTSWLVALVSSSLHVMQDYSNSILRIAGNK